MFSLFGKKRILSLKSPLIGTVKELIKVEDPVFSSKMMGEGVAIEPSVGILYSPVSGVVAHVFPTKHAVGIITDEGIEILLHIGIGTVDLMGEGFQSYVKENDRVITGDKLISFDIEAIKSKGKLIVTPMLITNMDMVEAIHYKYGSADNDSVIMTVTLK